MDALSGHLLWSNTFVVIHYRRIAQLGLRSQARKRKYSFLHRLTQLDRHKLRCLGRKRRAGL